MTVSTFPLHISGKEVASEQQLLAQLESGPLRGRVNFLIIHCSTTRADQDYTVDRLMRDHKANGFSTIGYHFYIRRNGEVSQHRRLLELGAHCRPWNRCSIGICYEGGLDSRNRPADTRTPAQRRALRELVAKLRLLFPGVMIRGHRDMPGASIKACPCFDVMAEFG